MKIETYLWIIPLVTFLGVQADVTLKFRLKSFTDASKKGYAPPASYKRCCDGSYHGCIKACSPMFHLCVKLSKSSSQCEAEVHTSVLPRQVTYDFNDTVGNTSNPFVLHLKEFHSQTYIQITVTASRLDGSTLQLLEYGLDHAIGLFGIPTTEPQSGTHMTQHDGNSYSTKIEFEYKIFKTPPTTFPVMTTTDTITKGSTIHSQSTRCNNKPCIHGMCTVSQSKETCKCDNGWTSVHCDVDINECRQNPYPCKNGGTCQNVQGGYKCTCKNNFFGQNCTKKCNCQNGGTCHVVNGSMRCRCSEGYGGDNCQTHCHCINGSCSVVNNHPVCNCTNGFTGNSCERDIDECKQANICNGPRAGKCTNTPGSYTCSCYRGYTGSDCHDRDECSGIRSVCHNNGTCINTPGSFHCHCQSGYSDTSRCIHDIDECTTHPCEHGTCHNSVGSYSCNCGNSGYKGTNCDTDIDECAAHPCHANHLCINNNGSYSCKCQAGFTGRHCDTDIDECAAHPCRANHLCINNNGSYSCKCQAGFTGRHCEINVNECNSNPCQHHGTCTDQRNGYMCHCRNGFTGKNCETNHDDCASNPCQGNGRCQDGIASYTCTCNPGFEHTQCDDRNECNIVSCNNGTCVNTPGSYKCYCRMGFTGDYCTVNINDCKSDSCHNQGVCIDQINGFKCNCKSGYSGTRCETNIDECISHPCKNNATCHDAVNSYTCTCVKGFNGNDCHININECQPNPCRNKGTCTDGVTSYTCSCPNGYTGHNCETNTNDCIPNPCKNSGQCTDGIASHTCSCPHGFTGHNCESNINDCHPNPCKNKGTCTDRVASYACSCLNGFTGKRCETNINECHSNPCKNNGRCSDGVTSYTCSCLNGFTGNNCETNINDCNPNPCKNNGQCTDGIASHMCSCPNGFNGQNCETNINDCHPNPCKNNGRCTDGVASFTCSCPNGFTGFDCHNNIVNTSHNPFTQSTHMPDEYKTISNGYTIEDTVSVSCNEFGWDISVDMQSLRQIQHGALASDIYLGENTCTGVDNGLSVKFHQGLSECLTSETTQNGVLVYKNELVYAQHDPIHPFIIRHYNWTISVECDIERNESSSGHFLSHDTHSNTGDHVTDTSHYAVNMTYYRDANYLDPIPGNPLHVGVGEMIYVKVFTQTSDWTIKMKVHTCYTKPTETSTDQFKYYIIKNGCEVDSNTHIISQSTHETRFVFENFRNTINHEGIFLDCDATFCQSSDLSQKCVYTCNPVVRRKNAIDMSVRSSDDTKDTTTEVSDKTNTDRNGT